MSRRFWQMASSRLSPVFLLALLLGAMPAKAQTYLQSVGVPPFTTELPVENGFVNAANGNLHIEIPLGSFPQRGGRPDKVVLMYDSAIWTYPYGFSNAYWNPDNISSSWGAGGWRIVTSRDAGSTTFGETDGGNCYSNSSYGIYSPWIWVGPDGTQHSFPVTTKQFFDPTRCPGTGIASAAGYASDGSGFYISITNYTNVVVYAPDGTQISDPATSISVEDTNGNYTPPVSYTTSNNVHTWTYTDTLGRTVLTEKNTLGSNVYTLQVPNAQGSTSTYTVNLETLPVYTNFGQPNSVECYGNCGWVTVIQSIQLPDGTSYSFNYDSGTTPGYYGLLKSMTLPTGGQVQYSFITFFDAYGDASRWLNGRTTPDGNWTYTPSVVGTCALGQVNCQQKLTVSKPSGDQTVYTFALNGGAWPIIAQYNTGSSALLSTTNQCWNFANTNSNGQCTYSPITASPTANVQKVAIQTTLPIPTGNVTATTEYQYDTYGNTTQISEWNFGNSPPNAADRTTSISYLTGAAYQPPNANIVNRPTNITVKNKAGATVAQTLYGYDVYTYNGGSLVGVTATGHDTNYGTSITARGNVTSIQNLVSGSTYLNSYRNYDTTGQVTNAFDPNNQKTAIGYACQNGYPTTITNPLSQLSQIGYDCNTGLVTSVQDPNNVANNQSASVGYDNMFRPTSIGYPDGGQTTLAYNYSGSTWTGSTSTTKVTSTQNLVTTNTTDGLGRVTSSVMTSDPDGSTTVTTSFDTNSRVKSVSNPYYGTPNGYETYVYDGLDRVTQITHVDGHVSSVYYGASVGSQSGSSPQRCAPGSYGAGYPVLNIDEANNELQSWIDGLGRTIEADEPTATSGNLTANTCYSYDANNNLTGVLAAIGNQTRSYGYDGLSRLISATNPENGTTTYTWDSASNMCGANGAYTSNGDLVKTTDAAGRCFNNYYDALHRLTDAGSPTGCQRFRYDNTNGILGSRPPGLTISNPLGRLVEAGTDTCAAWPVTQSSMITDEWSSYDPMGRVSLNTQCTPVLNCGTSYWSLNYGYDLLGDMTSYTNGAGVTFTQSFSGAGRLTSVTSNYSDANHPGTLLSNVHYNALGEPSSGTLGNGAVETMTYEPRGWPLTATVQSESTGTPGTGTVTINGSEQSHTTPMQNASQGPKSPSAATNDTSGYSAYVYWTNPTNVEAYDQQYATAGFNSKYASHQLNATGYGFSLPSNATVTGIAVTAYVEAGQPSEISDLSVYLLKAGSQVGTNHFNGQNWPTSETAYTYGSSSDLWGTTWAYSDINNSGFGVSYGVGTSDLGTNAQIDYISITVYYSTPPVTTYDSGTVTVTVNGQSAQPVQYANGNSTDTAVSIAGQLATNISALGFVTASNNGSNVITIKSTTNGTNTDYTLAASPQTNYPQYFNPPSFTTVLSNVSACGSATCMTGGTGAPGTLYSFSLGYGAGNNNVTTATDSVNGTWAFAYDYLNRLSTANQNNGQNICSFGYDQLGNRTSQKATAGSCNGNLSLSYAGNNNRMDGYSYDAAGNLLSDTVHTYAYDAWNSLITVDGGNTATYVYDALGRRVQRTGQFEYLYDLNGNIVAYLNSAGAWALGEIFANGQHLATYSGCGTTATTYFDHTDWLGTERDRSNMADANSESITSLPFGDLQFTSGSCGDPSPVHFTGQQRDSESSLHYFGARHYSTQFGRFMSPDPTGIFLGNLNDPQSLNLYAYVRNNPTSMTDPSGLRACDWSCDDSGFGFGIDFGIGWGGGGGGGDWGGGPQGPSYNPPGVGTSPNPNGSASDDPFSGETNGIPNGLQVPTLGLPGILMPSDPGCDLGACGVAQGFDNTEVMTLGGLCAAQPETCELLTIYVTAWGAYELYQALRPIIESHRTKIRPSTEQKHEEGQARQSQDRGGEKADPKRGYPRRRPKGWKGPWPPNKPGVPYW